MWKKKREKPPLSIQKGEKFRQELDMHDLITFLVFCNTRKCQIVLRLRLNHNKRDLNKEDKLVSRYTCMQ